MAPADSTLASGVRSVAVAGDVTNSVIVTGDDVTIELRIDTDDALLANLLEGSRVPRRTRRPLPLDGVPPPSPDHVDRATEAAAVRAAIGAAGTFDLSGPREIGKTFLVRHALAGAAGMPDGSVYVFARRKGYADVLQELHEAFIACDPPALAGAQQIRRDLAPRAAVVVLDAVELQRDELRDLAAVLPRCLLVLVAREPALGEGARLALGGLATDDALALVEQELARPLRDAERAPAEAVCALLGGHPFQIRQAAATVRDGTRGFDDLAHELSVPAPPASARELRAPASPASAQLAALLGAGLAPDETAIVQQLAALRGATVGAEHLAALAGTDDPMAALRALERRRLVASASPRFRIAGALHELAGADAARTAAYFATWARSERARPARVLAEAPALLELIDRAAADKRDADVVALGRASDAAFAHGRRWDTWRAVLDAVLAAAERTGDDSARAWALHQLGTRAYCLGEVTAAAAALQEALRLRERIGDEAGACATRYNLNFMEASPPPPDGEDTVIVPPEPEPEPEQRRSVWLIVAVVAIVALLGVIVAMSLGDDDDPSPAATTTTDAVQTLTVVRPPPPPISVVSPTVTVTETRTETVAPPPPAEPAPPPARTVPTAPEPAPG